MQIPSQLPILLATFIALGTACAPPVGSADVEGCEHLQNGPATAVTATSTTLDAETIGADHRRYDITLVPQGGSDLGGVVTFAPSEAADFVFFLGSDVPVAFATLGGQAVTPEASATGSEECSEIEGRHVVPLEVGTYAITFGPTQATVVSVVVEPLAHDD